MKRWIVFLALWPIFASAERLVICGGAEVFMIDAAAEKPEPLWSWRAKDHPEIPAEKVKFFATTDDCKPLADGRRMLISSSAGGCALIELPGGKVLWSAQVRNAHSIEALPGNRIVVAGSIPRDTLAIFNADAGDAIVWETPLPSGHGVVWDEARKRLYALGFQELRSYSLKDWDSAKPSLHLESTAALPDEDGHDLRAVPGSADLVLSTHGHVWLFDRDEAEFRKHPELGERALVKSIDIHPVTGRAVMNQASEDAWWSDTLEFLKPAGKIELKEARLYKARWLP